MNITPEILYSIFVTSLGIAVFIKLTAQSSPLCLLGHFICTFLADLLTPDPVEFLSIPVIMLFLLVYIRAVEHKPWQNTVYTIGVAAIVHIISVIAIGLPLWNAIPGIYNTWIYNFVIGAIQSLFMIVFALVLRNKLYLNLTRVQIHWVTVSLYGLTGYLTVFYPILIRILQIKNTAFCRILTNFNSVLCIVILVLGIILIIYLTLLKRQEDRYETLYKSAVTAFESNHDYHSKFRTMKAYIYACDWEGLTAFVKEHTGSDLFDGQPEKHLNQLKCRPLKAVIQLFIAEAEKMGAQVDINVTGVFDNPKMDVQALCDVINLYAQNCLLNCTAMQARGLTPQIQLMFEQKMLGAKIEFRNTVADEAAALHAIHKKKRHWNGHGYGLALTRKIISQQSNCTLSINVENGWFIERLIIRDLEDPQIKENPVENLAVRHGEQLLDKEVEKGSLEYETKINQVKFLYYNLAKLVPFLLLTGILHIFWETIVVLLLMIPLGSQAKGIHFKSDLGCFLYSVVGYLATVYLAIYLPLTWYAILIIWVALIYLYWRYAPCGHYGRPILQCEAQTLKQNSVFLVCLYGFAALLANTLVPPWTFMRFLYSALIYVCVAEAINILPLTYKILYVRRWE